MTSVLGGYNLHNTPNNPQLRECLHQLSIAESVDAFTVSWRSPIGGGVNRIGADSCVVSMRWRVLEVSRC